MADAIFRAIEEAQGDRPWGAVLDAGTGRHSLTWLRGLDTARLTAVTGEPSLAETTGGAVTLREQDALVVGNWQDAGFLAGQRFDVILADYLLGAVDAYAPYYQDRLFARLRPHLRPDGRLYVVGLEPSPWTAGAGWGALWLDVERLRDACIRLCGDRCYREYPRRWVEDHLVQAGFAVVETRRFPIVRTARAAERQLEVGRKKLPRIERRLAKALEKRADALLAQARKLERTSPRSAFGEDYLVVAELAGGAV